VLQAVKRSKNITINLYHSDVHISGNSSPSVAKVKNVGGIPPLPCTSRFDAY
jgi:hypothetical protein